MKPLRIAAALGLALCIAPLLRAQEPNPIPTTVHTIYPKPSVAQSQLQQAMALAARQHKRILLNFGNNQSPDCQVLADYLYQQPNQNQIAEHFLVVDINVGPNLNENIDLAERFGIPLAKGIPALAVLDSSGQVIHAQTGGQFHNTRYMSPSDVTEFLNKWRNSPS